ncbi:septation protein SepH [Microbacterium sp. gxy059]|uniref:septation protein SepH n=1 Tax=Microbacterium sp. gxy059 TaxID=2957199 RepID=UPI003D99C31A
MQQLTIVGTEGLTLVVATEHGQRFTLDIDDMLLSTVRRARADAAPQPREVGPSPRDIQARIRAGLSAEQVAELLDCPVERVRVFEGPVLAEREHIVGRALSMPVLTRVDLDQEENPTFGAAIQQKLQDLAASGERWTSWKDEESWIVKLTFQANGVEHDARWTYDPRRSALAPANDDAAQLSRQGRAPEGLIPRLRALESVDEEADDSTFEETAFRQEEPPAPEPEERPADTADLLEALRRKRGRREAAPAAGEDEGQDEDAPGRPLAILGGDDEPSPAAEEEPAAPEEPEEQPAAAETPRRRGRPAMPSWDEIVFGARSDD